jgi:hypothetical protein
MLEFQTAELRKEGRFIKTDCIGVLVDQLSASKSGDGVPAGSFLRATEMLTHAFEIFCAAVSNCDYGSFFEASWSMMMKFRIYDGNFQLESADYVSILLTEISSNCAIRQPRIWRRKCQYFELRRNVFESADGNFRSFTF